MEKVAFILGAGAHVPFEFPPGDRLKEMVADELTAAPTEMAETWANARRALLDCGVSIDRFLATNKPFNTFLRPLIARVLLKREKASIDAGMKDWLGYLWPLMIGKERGQLVDRFVFITFNYDRTTQYRIARAMAGLWGIPLLDARNAMDAYGIYHIYGSLGSIGPKGSTQHIDYGREDCEASSGALIKIIGEHTGTTTQEIHNRLKDAAHIFMLGCGFHAENMEVLALDKLEGIDKRKPQCSCAGLTHAERDSVIQQYPYLELCHETWTAIDVLRQHPMFQKIKSLVAMGKSLSA